MAEISDCANREALVRDVMRDAMDVQLSKIRDLVPRLHTDDPEVVHKIRVAFRRIRTLIRMVKRKLPKGATAELKDQFGEVLTHLGVVRNADVQSEIARKLGGRRADDFRKTLAGERAKSLEKCRQSLTSDFLRDLEEAVHDHIRQINGRFDKHRDRAVKKLHREISVRTKGSLLSLDDASIHSLRIDAKRLRYILELFPAFSESGWETARDQLIEVQDLIGDWRDQNFVRSQVRVDALPWGPVADRVATLLGAVELKTEPQSCDTMSEIETLIRAYFKAFNDHDLEAQLATLHDHVAHDINQGTREIGIDRFRAFKMHMDQCYREQITDLVIMINGDRGAAEFTCSGTYLATDEGLPEAKGQTYSIPAAVFFEARDGKLSRVTSYYNLQEWLDAVTK
ncbi:MAG: CHAD domain-containing protein [Armatimonadetes bacterium]|nr:CHAD domain-containing protein [Armatimonadota bacterium]